MSWLDVAILAGFKGVGYILAALLVLYIVTHVGWRILEAIYVRLWRWEYLVRTARHCARRTWLKPPRCEMRDPVKIDGVWIEEDDDDR